MNKSMDEERDYNSLVIRAFEKLAPIYDVVASPLVRVRDRVVDFTRAAAGATILDVATGTGSQAIAYDKRGYRVTGVDLTDAMLRIARRKNRDGQARFEQGDATHLRFESNCMDVTCISFALHDMPEGIRKKVLREMARVVKAGGTLVIVDYALPQNPIGRALVYRLVRLYEGEYYSTFIHSDVSALLLNTGIVITEELPVLLGAGRIWKGTKASR